MGAAAGMAGPARAQYHLRQVCVFVNMLPQNKPEVMIPAAQQKFDEEGRLADETTKDFIRGLLASLLRWTNQLRAGWRLPASCVRQLSLCAAMCLRRKRRTGLAAANPSARA